MEVLIQHSNILIAIAVIIGFLMACGIGANDVANAMATSIGTKSLTVIQALIIAAIFEFLGAYLAGGEVVNTIKDGIVDSSAFSGQPINLILGMISALFAAGTWLILASILGWPVSTTHSIIGAVIGFSLLTVGSDAIQWNMLWGILGSWFITPVMSGILAYLLFMSVQIAIFRHYHPLEHAKRIAPLYIAVTFFTLSIITIKSGLKHIGIELSNQNSIYVALGISVLTALIGKFFINRIKFEKNIKRKHYVNVEKVFTVGSIHEGTIVEEHDNGDLIQLEYGIDGFATPKHLIKEDKTKAKLNEKLPFKVLEFNKVTRRIILSHSRVYEDEQRPERKPKENKRNDIPEIQNQAAATTLGDIDALAELKAKMESAESKSAKAPKAKKASAPKAAEEPKATEEPKTTEEEAK